MNLKELKLLLEQSPSKKLSFALPDQSSIPAHFHITEVGCVRKDFIDCGGTERSVVTCHLQAWAVDGDEDHSLEAGKLAKILRLADKILPSEDLPVEVEFNAPNVSQFPILSGEIEADTLIFRLTTKHTDCLAKEQCGIGTTACC